MGKLSLTIVEILKIEDFKIILPSTYLEELIKEGWTTLLLLLNPKTNTINLVPSHSNKVHRVTLYLSKMAPEVLKQFTNIIGKYNIGTIFTSGVAFIDQNIFETYLDTSQYDDDKIIELIEDFSKVPGIIEVWIETISCE